MFLNFFSKTSEISLNNRANAMILALLSFLTITGYLANAPVKDVPVEKDLTAMKVEN